jgi:hypothetical protein
MDRPIKLITRSITGFANSLVEIINSLDNVKSDKLQKVLEKTKKVTNENGEIIEKGGELQLLKALGEVSKVMDTMYGSMEKMS